MGAAFAFAFLALVFAAVFFVAFLAAFLAAVFVAVFVAVKDAAGAAVVVFVFETLFLAAFFDADFFAAVFFAAVLAAAFLAGDLAAAFFLAAFLDTAFVARAVNVSILASRCAGTYPFGLCRVRSRFCGDPASTVTKKQPRGRDRRGCQERRAAAEFESGPREQLLPTRWILVGDFGFRSTRLSSHCNGFDQFFCRYS